uniref:Uncharacterized protein n=1 Tax=Panagrolaimus superbus TaxID=310955 RepID=A0A914Y6M4_9BILA
MSEVSKKRQKINVENDESDKGEFHVVLNRSFEIYNTLQLENTKLKLNLKLNLMSANKRKQENEELQKSLSEKDMH